MSMTIPIDQQLLDLNGSSLAIGQLLKIMDACSCMSAEKYARNSCVTAAMDDVVFHFPDRKLQKSDVVIIKSQVNRAWATSMEVGVTVAIEDVLSGTKTHVCSAYFTFVALKPDKSKAKLPPLAISQPTTSPLSPTFPATTPGALSPSSFPINGGPRLELNERDLGLEPTLGTPPIVASRSTAATDLTQSNTTPQIESLSLSSPSSSSSTPSDTTTANPPVDPLEALREKMKVQLAQQMAARSIDDVRRWEEAQERRNLRLQRRSIIAQVCTISPLFFPRSFFVSPLYISFTILVVLFLFFFLLLWIILYIDGKRSSTSSFIYSQAPSRKHTRSYLISSVSRALYSTTPLSPN